MLHWPLIPIRELICRECGKRGTGDEWIDLMIDLTTADNAPCSDLRHNWLCYECFAENFVEEEDE